MKKLSLLLFTLCGLFITAHAQLDHKVSVTQAQLRVGLVPALSVTMYFTTVNQVEKDWSRLLKKMDGKTDGKANDGMADNVNYPELSNTPVDMYYSITQQNEHVKLIVAVDMGTGIMNPGEHPNQYNVMKGLVADFAKQETISGLEQLIKTEEKTLKDLESNLKGLKKDQSKLEDDIKDYQERIEDAKVQIASLINNQGVQQEAIKNQEERIKTLEKKLKSVN